MKPIIDDIHAVIVSFSMKQEIATIAFLLTFQGPLFLSR